MKNIFITLITTIILIPFACNPKEEIAPENPCDGQEEVKAGFVIEELIGDRWFEGDTIADYGNKVRFRALQKADSYMWILGDDTLYQQTVTKNSFPLGWLDVKLVVNRKPNKTCFPDDDGIDSSERKFYVWPVSWSLPPEPPRFKPYPIYGTYRGHNLSNPNHEFNVTLYDTFWKNGVNQPAYVGLVNGIPYVASRLNKNVNNNVSLYFYCKGKISPLKLKITIDAAMGNQSGDPLVPMIPVMVGYAWLDRHNLNKINIEYSYADTIPLGSSDLKNKDTFIGNRIY